MGKAKKKKKVADHRNEGFKAREAFYEHNEEKTKLINKQIATKVGLKMYTEEEQIAKGGPVTEYNYNNRYTWEEFKAMPEENKKQYIRFLKEKYDGIAASDIAAMMGVSDYAVSKVFNKIGIKPNKKGALNKNQREAKRRFWNEMVEPYRNTEPENTEPKPSSELEPNYVVQKVSFVTSADEVTNALKAIGFYGKVYITAEVIEESEVA